MVKKNTLYKCEICGNVVDVVSAAAPEIHCCGQPMNEIISKTIEQEGKEKHIPIVTIEGNNINSPAVQGNKNVSELYTLYFLGSNFIPC